MVTLYYFDTSALLKMYVTETGSSWVQTLLAARPTIFISQLTLIEVACAFARRHREGILNEEKYARLLISFDYDARYTYQVMDLLPITIDTAKQLAYKQPLRAYDAIQLATAWLIQQELSQTKDFNLTFLSADQRLLTIAQAEGLAVDNPNLY